MAPSSSLGYQDTSSLLFGRDACSNAFGSNASDQRCNPSQTLCCYRKGQQFPVCQQTLGRGWCCVGTAANDNCYVDQPSVCGELNSVPCTYLANGTTEACCPRLTSCATDIPAHKEMVRCNIQYSDLQRAAVADSSSSSATSSTSTVSTSSSSTGLSTTATSSTVLVSSAAGGTGLAGNAAQTPFPTVADSQQSQGASGLSSSAPGLVAGAAVGGTLGFVALLVLGYLFLRKSLKTRQQGGGHPPPPPPPVASHSQPAYGNPDYAQTTTTVEPASCGYPKHWVERVEIMAKDDHAAVELPAGR